MGRRTKPPSMDFIEAIEGEREEAKNAERMEESILCNTPSELVLDGEREWVKLQGATPLEFLAMVYKNPWNDMNHRVNAAKSILDYVHRKLPSKIEIEGNVRTTKAVTAASLSKLSDSELEAFTKLLDKMGDEK